MRLFHTQLEIRQYILDQRCKGHKIGLIPTMGALHEGHLSLVRMSVNASDLPVASVFVNPTQFNNPEDLEKYPRNLDKDLELLESAGCQAVFAPSTKEMYPFTPSLTIGFGSLETELEGRFREGHFKGVGLVVSKLFNIVQPDNAYFGQKDLQQYFIIERLVQQLSFPIKLKMAPIMREPHGLAMSSRNERLSEKDRAEAGLIYQSLQMAREELLRSGHEISEVKQKVAELFKTSDRLSLEYFEVISTDDFKPLNEIKNKATTALCIATEIGQVRLIDNLLLIS
ncbi:MAG: pantoate--beta-alanine ligase [Roseivirga sp.]|nr:pantoate--beta-alanine ligase [Roseivirga sp.]